MNTSNIIIFDFETTSKSWHNAQPIQIAAKAIDGRRLSIEDSFSSYIVPIFDEEKCTKLKLAPLSDEVVKKTKITRDMLETAPNLKTVWKNFTDWVNKFNYKQTKWTAPIAAGHNIINYDIKIVNRICGEEPYKYGPYDDEYQCQALFNPVHFVDTMNICWYWFESRADIKSLSMDSLREYFGMDDSAAHNAVFDVEQSTDMIIRFLKLSRNYSPKIKFKGTFAKCGTDKN